MAKTSLTIKEQKSLNALLSEAARVGDIKSAISALDSGADIHADTDSALGWAARNGHMEIVALLLDRGADIHADNDHALRLAALHGRTEIVALLLDRGADIHADTDYALRWAALNGHTEIVALLLDRGADIHAYNDSALRKAALNGHTEIVALLLDRGADIHADNDYALRKAAEYGHTETVALLLDRGADIHADTDYALRKAAENGHTEIVALLLDRGADIHADNDSALRLAAENGHTETAALLLDRGADIHADNDSALGWAARNGHTETMALLLDRGADIHAYTDYALRMAAQSGHTETAALLLDRGADIHADNDYALRLAAENGHTETVALLEAHKPLESAIVGAKGGKGCRSVLYQAAYIGLRQGMGPDRLAAFASDTLRRSLKDTPLARIPQDRALDPAQLDRLFRESEGQLEIMAQKIGISGYLQAGHMRDMISEYADAVLLPRLLLAAGLDAKKIAARPEEDIRALQEKLLPLAACEMLSGKRLDEMLAMSKAWHTNGNALPHELRPYLPDRWQKLIEDVETPFAHEGEKLVIRALPDKRSLVMESAALNHCVGRGSHYINGCAAGTMHIISVQTESGTPLATREVTLTGDPKAPIKQNQFHGRNNGSVPALAQQAMDWFDKELKEGKVTFNTPQNGKWGKLPEIESKPPALQTIGYAPTQERIAQCLGHYEKHLLIKEPFLSKSHRSGAFSQPKRLEESYHWKSALRKDDIPAPGGEWKALVQEVAKEYGGMPAPVSDMDKDKAYFGLLREHYMEKSGGDAARVGQLLNMIKQGEQMAARMLPDNGGVRTEISPSGKAMVRWLENGDGIALLGMIQRYGDEMPDQSELAFAKQWRAYFDEQLASGKTLMASVNEFSEPFIQGAKRRLAQRRPPVALEIEEHGAAMPVSGFGEWKNVTLKAAQPSLTYAQAQR